MTLTNTSGGAGGGVALAFNTYPPPPNASPSSAISVIDDGNYGNSISISTKMPGAATNSLVERILIRSDGNIGIGLSERDERDGEPSSLLVVAGDVKVTGDVLLSGADCAEHFDVGDANLPEPGTVVVIDENGALRESSHAYDKKVAGVVSGAGEYRHGIVLDKRPEEGRIPVALVGKVFCKVSGEFSPVAVGDLLTTSPTPGYAMKAVDPARAFGAVLGKALNPLHSGLGLVPVLVTLQ